MVAAAYLIAGRDGVGAPQVEPFNAALIAAGAGLCASALIAAIPSKATPGTTTRDTTRDNTTSDNVTSDKPTRRKAARGKHGSPAARSGQVAIPSQPERALVGEIVDGRAAVAGQAAASPSASPPDRVSEADYASWIRDLGERQRA